jgi:phage baseplate assembly protein W
MQGTNAFSGGPLSGVAHLRQSIRDILTTPIGSRVMRRDYGSRLFQLTDAPANRSTVAEIYAATVDALNKWEPRFSLSSVTLESSSPGRLILSVIGKYLPDGQLITMDGIEVV